MLTRQYRIDLIDRYEIMKKYADITTRRRRMVDEKLNRLVKAIDTFNEIVDDVNF